MDGGPKFPGDLSDHMPRREDLPDRWVDRLRHAWFLYAILAVAVPMWIGAMISAVMWLQPTGWFVAIALLFAPLGIYARMLLWRFVTSRELDTGERLDRRHR